MTAFESYVDQIDSLAQVPPDRRDAIWRTKSAAALDGQPADVLRRSVPIEKLRKSGAFFTGAKLSAAAARLFADSLDAHSRILDPACGAGDLLIACSTLLQAVKRRPSEAWASQLFGRDLQASFVHAAKVRLLLASLKSGGSSGIKGRAECSSKTEFKNIKVGCGLSDRKSIRSATHIILNPPFTLVDAPRDCAWGSGKVNSAALFLERCIADATPGTRIVAILSDVLRSGRRYRTWRKFVADRCRIVAIRRYRRFARWADVHVFVLSLVVEESRHETGQTPGWEIKEPRRSQSIEAHFDVSVGPVVHFRDQNRGPLCPYLVSKKLPAWKATSTVGKTRRYSGRLAVPPFVAVRRTSRPEDEHRALATIITGNTKIAVDNHLLVLQPKDRKLATCRRLLRVLKRSSTTAWLNQRIRCRHLTVGALKQLPWSK